MPKIRHAPCSSHFFCVEMWFFLKNICYFKNIPYLCTRKGLSVRGWATKLILWNETSGQLFGQSRKDVFETLPVSIIKSRKFESKYDGDATETSTCRLISYIPTPDISFIYIIRCTFLGYYLCVYGQGGETSGGRVYLYHLAWAGFTLLIFTKGQCESLMIGIGAAETYFPRLFLFP